MITVTRPPRRIPRGTQTATPVTVAAPVGGWNAREALGAMPKLDAVILQNFWPGTNNVQLRKGYSAHATGLPDQAETLMTFSGGSANTMFAVADGEIYDVTSAGAVGAAAETGLSNSRFQHVNFTTTAGQAYLLAVNGADKLRSYNGTAWNADGEGATYDITGLDTTTASNITVFKNRVWLLENNTLKAWYLGVGVINGAATALNLTSVAAKGGYLMAAMTWTLDGGYGMDDHLAFITSKGEVIVYRMTDPTDASTIALIGVFNIGAPIGRRCWLKYGGDLLIITDEGVIPMSAEFLSTSGSERVSITDKIRLAMADAVKNYGSNFGWQLIDLPKENQLYLNVPVFEGSAQQQYVQNNITRAWCNFTGWEANCWEILNKNLYFGGDGVVNKAWDGTSDDEENIEGLALQSFQAYGGARQKQCSMIRYHLSSDGSPALYGNVNVDYDTADRSAELTTSAPVVGLWDVGLWDVALWGSTLVGIADWQGATGIGWTFAPFLKTATNRVQLQWTATDMVFEPGGVL